MKIEITKEESMNQIQKKLDICDTLNMIPKILMNKLQLIQKEINDITNVLNHYDHIKEKFNDEHFNIQTYINNYLNNIKSQIELVYLENKKVDKQIKNINLPDIKVIEDNDIKLPDIGNKQVLRDEIKTNKDVVDINNLKPIPTSSQEEEVSLDKLKGLEVKPGKNINLTFYEQGFDIGGDNKLTAEDQKFLRLFGGE